MKIKNISNGPLALTKVEYYPRLSQETTAFSAKIAINGLVGEASNDGNGGETLITPREVAAAVDAYAKTLPSYEAYGMTMHYTGESLISMLIYDESVRAEEEKEQAREIAKYLKKGCKFRVVVEGRVFYCVNMPTTEALTAKFGSAGNLASIKRIDA
jgi:hypothetical protein